MTTAHPITPSLWTPLQTQLRRLSLTPALTMVSAALGTYLTSLLVLHFGHGPSDLAIAATIVTVTIGMRDTTRRAAKHHWWLRMIPPTILIGVSFLPLSSLSYGEFGSIFIAGVCVAQLLRALGPRLSVVGGLITQSATALLIMPVHLFAASSNSHTWTILVLVIAGLWSMVLTALVPQTATRATPIPPPTRKFMRQRTLQNAITLSLALYIGQRYFPQEAQWALLTAFIVSFGAQSRGEVLVKSVQRFAGALAGAVLGSLLGTALLGQGILEGTLIFGVLFISSFLRPLAYAYWAFGITLVLSQLYALLGEASNTTHLRLLGIVVGTVCALAVAFLLAPIKSRTLLRRDIALALRSASDCLDELTTGLETDQPITAPAALLTLKEQMTHLDATGKSSGIHYLPESLHPGRSWLNQAKAFADALDTYVTSTQRLLPNQYAAAMPYARLLKANLGRLRQRIGHKAYKPFIPFPDGQQTPYRISSLHLNKAIVALASSLA